MKHKIVAIAFLLILLNAGCKLGDPVIGNWQTGNMTDMLGEPIGDTGNMSFNADGTYSENLLFSGKWKRLDANRLEIQTDAFARWKSKTRIVTIKIEGNTLTETLPDGSVTKWKRQ